MSILGSKRGLWNTMPQGTIALFFIQVVSTLSFSVLYSTLVLYMKGKLGLAVSTANSIMGVFIAFNFALHLLGGFWGGRLLSNRSLFCVGMIAQVIGCILLSVGGVQYLYYGLAAFLTGSGLNVTCLNCMLTQRFAPDDTRRETAFLWNYAGMNIGFFIGFSLSGIFQMSQNYQRLFLLSSLGNLIALLICLYCWHQLADRDTNYSRKAKAEQKKATGFGIGLILLLPLLLSQMLQYADWANKLVIVTGIAMLVLIIYIAHQQPAKQAKDKILAFAVLMIVGTIFWMLYQIGPMGLTVFIDHNVQREYANWIIPPQWFQNINTLAIVIGGPLLGVLFQRLRAKGVGINIPTQFALALFFIGVAFAILPIGIVYANSQGMVNPGWIVACFILQSIGELLISPIGYAMIGALAPAPLQGVMMGMWMLNTGVGATLSSYSSNLMIVDQQSNSPLLTNSGYSHVFLILGLFAIASSFVLLALIPKLRKLIQEKKCVSANEANILATNSTSNAV
jgi:proton-dependent oligopeptide transporter, POT family